jgi:hypothetical protein
MFPTDPYEANNFQQTIASLLPIFYMLAFLYPFSRFIRGLVLEKETKIKEGMKIMGLSDVAYGLSWLITLTIQGVITCLLILLVTRSTVFEFSDDMPIFLYVQAKRARKKSEAAEDHQGHQGKAIWPLAAEASYRRGSHKKRPPQRPSAAQRGCKRGGRARPHTCSVAHMPPPPN